MVIQEEVGVEYVDKTDAAKWGEVGQMIWLTKVGWGIADIGGRRGTGGLDPPFLADIICEQPLN